MALASEDSPYWVRSSVEVRYALNELRKARATLTCELPQGGDSFTTEILSATDDSGLVLDVPPLQAQLDAAQRASKVVLRTASAGVKIDFELERLSVTNWENGPALRAPLPARILKVQRRNFFRIAVPKSRPVACVITAPGVKPFAYPILDIGLGGVALFSGEGEPTLQEGKTYDKCKIALPETGNLEPKLLVRHVAIIRPANRPISHRYGCEFVDLPGPLEALIQRFVLLLERDRRAASLVDVE